MTDDPKLDWGEPWHVTDYTHEPSGTAGIASDRWEVFIIDPGNNIFPEPLARMVACVNACVGHADPGELAVAVKERDVARAKMAIMGHHLDALRAQNAEYEHSIELEVQKRIVMERARVEAADRNRDESVRKWAEIAGRLEAALHFIAAPKRADGTWNRDREACRIVAQRALDGESVP